MLLATPQPFRSEQLFAALARCPTLQTLSLALSLPLSHGAQVVELWGQSLAACSSLTKLHLSHRGLPVPPRGLQSLWGLALAPPRLAVLDLDLLSADLSGAGALGVGERTLRRHLGTLRRLSVNLRNCGVRQGWAQPLEAALQAGPAQAVTELQVCYLPHGFPGKEAFPPFPLSP